MRRRLNRSQLLVIGFFVAVWIAVAVILAAAPEIYTLTLRPPRAAEPIAGPAFLGALAVFLALVSAGIVRRWRWLFWLVVLAFLSGILRVPAAVLEARGLVPASGPGWYVAFQAVVGVIQFAIAIALLRGYRRAGPWGEF